MVSNHLSLSAMTVSHTAASEIATAINPGPEPQARVLLVEDDQGLRESLAIVLAFQGLDIIQANSAEEGRQLLREHEPDLVVLDVNLPGDDGLEFLRELRGRGDDRQVLLLTALQEVEDRVAGLDAGADDYLAKPFALEELLARIRVMMRRADVDTAPTGESTRQVGGVAIDGSARRVTVNGDEVRLTKRQFEVLDLLFDHPDHVLSRSVIHDEVWGYAEDFGSNTLEVVISSLRRKLEVDDTPRVIHTVRGVGYVARAGGRPSYQP